MQNNSISRTYFIIGLTVLVLIIIGLSMVRSTSKTSVSPYILQLTLPITTFSGTVESVNGDTITISQYATTAGYAAISSTPISGTPPVIPTPVKITYTVKVTKQTSITKPFYFYINYLFPTVIPTTTISGMPLPPVTDMHIPPQTVSLKDIKKGTILVVNSSVDLRSLSGTSFTATSITLPAAQTTLSGVIKKVQGNILVIPATIFSNSPMIGGMVGSMPPPIQRDYIVEVTNNTEISRYKNAMQSVEKPGAAQEPEKLSLADLKEGMQVTVYTNVDIMDIFRFKALRVEPGIELNPPVETPVATSSVEMP